MFGLGGTEVLVIFALALLLFGPRKLPEIGRTLGKTLAEFRRATMDFRVSLEREVELDKLKSDTLGPLRDIVGLGEPRPTLPPPVPTGGAAPPATQDPTPAAGPPSEPEHDAGRNDQA
jgi:sec-independent protein translocase protein TatB